MLRIVRLPQPVIAEVKGITNGGGCQLVASCDLAVAADDATFATSGVNIGLFLLNPYGRAVSQQPRKQAMEMLLLGEFCPLAALPKSGYQLCSPFIRVGNTAMDMARIIAVVASAVKIGKRAFYEQVEMLWKRPIPLPVALWQKT